MSPIEQGGTPSAHQRLQPSRLTDQLEALGFDVDLSELELALRSKASLPILEMVTDATVERTIAGASALTLTLLDRDRRVEKSGLLVKDTSVKVDGLWFRLVNVNTAGAAVTLTFEDREVNVLRNWPPTSEPKLWPRVRKVADLGPVRVARALFAQSLIDDVSRILEIRFVCPALKITFPIQSSRDRKDAATRQQQAGHGLPPGAKITVQLAPATPEQIKNTERVLDVGDSMGVSREVMVWSVMVINDESRAENLAGGDADSRGIFQQRKTGGRPDGGGRWPASLDIETDAHAFFEVAQWVEGRIQSGALPPLTNGAACSEIQRDATWGTSQQGSNYARFEAEADNTVALYLGESGTTPAPVPVPPTPQEPVVPPPPQILDDGTPDTAFQFTRGTRTTSHGHKIWKREDNWTCLQRLAAEVRWRCYCVSGTVYFTSEHDLFTKKPAATLTRETPGVDSIDGTYDIGMHNAHVTVNCRADRWQAPPGSVVVLDETGIFDGRWIVETIRHPLFTPDAQITLKKPTPALPETKAPEYGAGQTSGTQTYVPKHPAGSRQPPPGKIPVHTGGPLRNKIVEVAMKALDVEKKWHYHYIEQRPYPAGLFVADAHDPGIDCSAFVHLVYKEAGAPDPSGNAFDGSGNTCSIWGHCRHVTTPGLGDLILYADPCRSTAEHPSHVGIEVGAGLVVEIGSQDGIKLIQANYRTDVHGYATVFPEGQ